MHRIVFFRPATATGQTQSPSFVAATAELASIADAGEAWRGPRRSATSQRRQVLPNDRTPRKRGRRLHRATSGRQPLSETPAIGVAWVSPRGHANESSTPSIPPTGNGRCRPAGRLARCKGADLSGASHYHDRAGGCGRPLGCDRADCGEHMKKSLGQPVIIENVSGADGNIGVGRTARAKPDGYTIDVGFLGPHVLNGVFYSLPYDVLNDFSPISLLVTLPLIIFGRQTMAAKDLNELISWLKTNPKKASVGVTAVGPRLVATFFQKETGTQFSLVPYRGSAPAAQDLVAGQIDLFIGGPDLLPLTRAGSIKAFAVTSDTRLAQAPDIPTVGEMGLPALLWSAWYALFAPKGTPKDIITKLNRAAVEALADPTVRARYVDLGFEVFPRERQTPEALGALVKADAEKWWPLIKEFGIKVE
jgi:tripartite-type tricarboxylate transporter receptor subunit TctC